MWGLAFHGDDLYAGNDDFAMKPPFTVGVSKDGGRTFRSVMSRCDVSLPTCGDASTSEHLCREQWTRLGGYVTDILASCPTGGAAGTAAAGTGPTSSSGGASSCSVPPNGGAGASGGGGSSCAPPAAGHDDRRGHGEHSSSCSVDARARTGPDMTILVVAGAAFSAALGRRKRP